MGTKHAASRAIVVTGGSSPDPRLTRLILPSDLVVCADSGFDHAESIGLSVDVIVGDLDSISSTGLARARRLGVEVSEARADKNETDTELALAECLLRGVTSVVLLTGGGDRIDHLLGVIAALSDEALDVLERLDAWFGGDHLSIVRPHRPTTIDLAVGSTLSLLALSGPALGVRTSGLEWALNGDTLDSGRAMGVSNRAIETTVSVSLDEGCLAVIAPGRLDTITSKGATS